MKNNIVHAWISYMLLVAMCVAVVPVHHIFHQHKNEGTHSLQVKQHDNPCCKLINNFTGTACQKPLLFAFNTSAETVAVPDFFEPVYPVFHSSHNKAPPVSHS